MKIDVKTLDAGSSGSLELPDHIFGIKDVRSDILHRMVRYQLAKRRAGTHHAQDRKEVNVTGKKMYKQKGTGGARHGDKSVPQWRGGGKAFGPKPRSHAHDLPKKVRALALRHALSAKANANEIMVIERAATPEAKTAKLKAQLGALGLKSALIVGGADLDHNFVKAARNIPNIDLLPAAGINVYDVLRCRKLVLTKDAVAAIETRFAPAAEAKESRS
jgi:large subunit ribosomal protein L4